MTQSGIEPRSSGLLANTLPTRPMSRLDYLKACLQYGFAKIEHGKASRMEKKERKKERKK